MADNKKVTELTQVESAQIIDLIYLITYDADGVPSSVGIPTQTFLNATITGVNRIISGTVVWTGVGYTFKAIDLSYEINGVIYFITNVTITNDAPNAQDRLDSIFVDASGLDIKKGTPAATPAEPTLDNPTTEIKTNLVLVQNGESTPSEITLETIYSENLQESGGEWDTAESSSGARITLGNTTDPINLTKDILADAPIGGDYFTLINTTPILISSFRNLRQTFRSLENWKSDWIQIEFYDSATQVGYAFVNSTIFNTKDLISDHIVYIDRTLVKWFDGETQFDQIKYIWIDAGGASPVSTATFHIDLILIEHGGETTPSETGIITASKVVTDTTDFSYNLTSNEDTAQKAFEKLDAASTYIDPANYTGTDTEKIQAALDDAAGTDKSVLIFRKNVANDPWDIEEAITLASNTSVLIDGAILQLTDTSRDNIFRTENCGFGITAPFDELENIHITGINGATLMGADDPRATGDADKDLVDDGTDLFNKSYGNDTGVGGETQTGDWRNIGILFAYTDRYSVTGINFEQMHMWSVSNEKCTRGRFERLTFSTFAERTIATATPTTQYVRNNDGVNFRMGCSNMIVDDVTGHTDDDTIASTIYDSAQAAGIYGTFEVTGNTYAGVEHDNFNITIKNINTSTDAHNVRLFDESGNMYDITVQNITNLNTTDDTDGAVVVIGLEATTTLGNMYNVSLDNIKNAHKPYTVQIRGGLADSNVNNVIDSSTINNDYPVFFEAAGVGARDVQMTNIFKTDEANDLIALFEGAPAIKIAIGSDFTDKILKVTGEFDLQDNSIGGTVQTATGDGTTTIDWKDGNMFDFQFGAFNETFTFTAPTNPGTFILKLVQDSVGSRTATWPGTVEWPGGTAPTLTTTATTGTDIITFYYNGTGYFAVESLDFS